MSNYNVVKGDNLWNLTKKEYGSKLKNNADIQKAVNEIANYNNIENPNSIFVDQVISFPSYEELFSCEEFALDDNEIEDDTPVSTPTPKETEKAENSKLYNEMGQWISDSHKALMKDGKEFKMFDFVKTNVKHTDEAFADPWKDGLKNLANSNMAVSDTDENGTLSYQEYISQEMEQYNGLFPDDKIDFDQKTGEIKNSKINQSMKQTFAALDVNHDKNLDTHELAAYYAALDTIDSTGGYADGKIQLEPMINIEPTSNFFQTRFTNAYNFLAKDEK